MSQPPVVVEGLEDDMPSRAPAISGPVVVLGAILLATAVGVYATADAHSQPTGQDDRANATLLAAARVDVPAATSTTISVVAYTLAPGAELTGGPLGGFALIHVEAGELLVVRPGQGRAQLTTVLGAGQQLTLAAGSVVRVQGGTDGRAVFTVVALVPRDSRPARGARWTNGWRPIGAANGTWKGSR